MTTHANTQPFSNPHAQSALPRVAILSTGGTIAGAGADAGSTVNYRAGALGIEALVRGVPELARTAQVVPEAVCAIDSKDMTTALWSVLLARVNAMVARDDIDGVVITHGTDTLEETAYFLHLLVKSDKPVVLTGAMRPATALSADGPLNLLHAVTVAASAVASGLGVLVVFNGRVHGAREVTKVHTVSTDAFASPDAGPLGWVADGHVEINRLPARAHTLRTAFRGQVDATPEVAIVVSHAGATRVMVDAAVAAGVRGIVVAGTGNGSIHAPLHQALADAAARGVAVVRASRVGAGPVIGRREADDGAPAFVSAGNLNAFKARVLLMVALAHGIDRGAPLQALFDLY